MTHPLPEAPTSASPRQEWTQQRAYAPAPAKPSRLIALLPDLFAALIAFNMLGLFAALWLNAPDAALCFDLGMIGASIALIGCSFLESR